MKQCLGLASSLSDLTDAEIVSYDIPKLSGMRRFFAKLRIRQLLTWRKEEILSWLSFAKGESMLRGIGQLFSNMGIKECSPKVLLISAGSEAAPYHLAIGTLWQLTCASIGNPAHIGTRPFEFAIIPGYEAAQSAPNILKIVTPLNNVDRNTVKQEAALLKKQVRPNSKNVWSVLIDRDKKDCHTSVEKLKRNMDRLIKNAELSDADLYIAVSENVSRRCRALMEKLSAENDVIRYLRFMPEKDFTTIQALTGIADYVFCTENSVDIVSEVITGGGEVVLLRTNDTKGLKTAIQKLKSKMIEHGGLSAVHAKGAVRNAIIYDRFKRHGKLDTFDEWMSSGNKTAIQYCLDDETKIWQNFNEAERAAEWIATSLAE